MSISVKDRGRIILATRPGPVPPRSVGKMYQDSGPQARIAADDFSTHPLLQGTIRRIREDG